MIRTKLRNLRTYYSKQLQLLKKSIKSGAGVSDVYKPNWEFFDTVHAFLRDQVTSRQSISSLVSTAHMLNKVPLPRYLAIRNKIVTELISN